MRNVPVEITETITPLVFWKKELRADSGGPGKYRGGVGQVMHVANRENAPFAISARFDRVFHPARGREGGMNGATGRLCWASGKELRPKGMQTVPPNDMLVVEMPGGGGFGEARSRDINAVASDVLYGLVSPEAARNQYGVAVDADGQVDQKATSALRRRRTPKS